MASSPEPWVPGTEVYRRCYVEGCEHAGSPGVLRMLVPGSQVVRERRVLLCVIHERIARVPGARLRLAAHPDDHADDMTLPGV